MTESDARAKRSTDPATLIQYRCEHCGDPITVARYGWLEFYSRANGVGTYSRHGVPVYGTVHHQGCGEDLANSYAIRLQERPARLATLE